MAIVQQSRTDRFILQYDDQIAPAQQLAQTLSQTIEADFYLLRSYLPFDQDAFPDAFMRHPTPVIFIDTSSATTLGLKDASSIPGRGGARNFALGPGRAGTLWINAFGATNNPLTPDFARFLFIAEMSEQLMGFYGWDAGNSRGEALSRILAEQFFPAAGYAAECISIAPWINGWLNSSPRFDYLNQNPAPTPANANLGTDTDQPGYGCGMLFINYLRYQLGYPLAAICQAGGVTFADTYKNLTGRTDDPLVAMNDLITKHFDGSFFNLLDNNPFPLLEQSARQVTVGTTRSIRTVPSAERAIHHVAHLSPFITCPEKDYSFHRVRQAVTWTVTAFPMGFALPQFKWFVNGKELFVSTDNRQEALSFEVPDPNHPRVPKAGSGNATFEWTFSTTSQRGEGTDGVLVITNDSYDGVYRLDIKVEVSELYGGEAATPVVLSLAFEGLRIAYEQRYYEDGRECERRFERAIPSLQKEVDLVLGRPDPPVGDGLAEVIRSVDAIRREIERIGQTDPELAASATEYAAARLEVEASLLSALEKRPRGE